MQRQAFLRHAWVAVFILLTVVLVPPVSADVVTVGFDFSAAVPGDSCVLGFIGSPVISLSASVGTTQVVDSGNAGSSTPECMVGAGGTLRITLNTRATGISFPYSNAGTIRVELFDGAALVSDQSFNTATGLYSIDNVSFNEVAISFDTGFNYVDVIDFKFGADDPVARGAVGFNPNDSRVAPHPGAVLNLYSFDYGLVVYRTSGSGTGLALYVPEADITAVGIPAENTMIAQADGVALYRLSDGMFQLMSAADSEGKRDFVIFELDSNNQVTRWRRGQFLTLENRSIIYAQSSTADWAGYETTY